MSSSFKRSETSRGTTSRLTFLVLACVLIAGASYLYGVPDNPPGFYIDESSIAYNAHTISRSGRDEYGHAWPLYFHAFGENKNPIYIYLLASVFKLTGPSITTARLLSAALGLVAVLLLGLLAMSITRRRAVCYIVTLSALLTPWLFENSRPVFEVALYPALVAIFLFTLHWASKRDRWNLIHALSLAATLALLTYSYSIGRLFAPLLALGLVFFITRRRLCGVLIAWCAYALTLVPLFVFHWRHPNALTDRFWLLTYIKPQSTFVEIALEFVRRYLGNINPWRLAVTGELNIRDHVGNVGSVLTPTIILALLGLALVLRYHRRDAWWRFVLYALAASIVPASLTTTQFPQIRLVAFPVLLHVLLIPAVSWLLFGVRGLYGEPNERPVIAAQPADARQRGLGRLVFLGLLLVSMLIQGTIFRWQFHRAGPGRASVFDEQYSLEVFPTALALNRNPIYLYDPPGKSGYIQAYWHGTLRGLDASQFIRMRLDETPPAGAVVISTEEGCTNCRLVLKSIDYIVYVAGTSDSR